MRTHEALHKFCQILWTNNYKKRTFFWYGASNTGKSKFGDMLEALFTVNTYSSSGKSGWSVIEGPRNQAAQIVVLNEAALGSLFGKTN